MRTQARTVEGTRIINTKEWLTLSANSVPNMVPSSSQLISYWTISERYPHYFHFTDEEQSWEKLEICLPPQLLLVEARIKLKLSIAKVQRPQHWVMLLLSSAMAAKYKATRRNDFVSHECWTGREGGGRGPTSNISMAVMWQQTSSAGPLFLIRWHLSHIRGPQVGGQLGTPYRGNLQHLHDWPWIKLPSSSKNSWFFFFLLRWKSHNIKLST